MRWQKVLASIKKKKGRKLDRSGGERVPFIPEVTLKL